MSLATDADESEPSVAFDSLPDNIRESIRAEAPDLVDQGRIPISRLRNPEDIFEIPPLPLTVVNFRIVGVYLGSVPGRPPDKNTTGDVQVLVFDNDPTVKDVVDAVEREANQGNITGVNGFRYDVKTMSNGSQILDRVEVDYTQSPKPSRGYAAGTYVLQQQLNQDPQRVFQYYIYDVEPRSGQADAVRRKNTDNSFIGFNRQPSNSINDGDYVVWRLLTIRTEPDSPMGEDSDDDRISTPPRSRVSSPEVRLPDGIIRTNSRLARMAAQGSAQPLAGDAPDTADGEDADGETDAENE
jgi:hypothetical protein